MIKMLKRWRKLSALEMFVNLGQLGISLWVIAIGCFLIGDKHYFFWPPTFRNIENDTRIDTLIILIGLALFLCTIFCIRNKYVIVTLYTLIGAISLALAALSGLHAYFAGHWEMGLDVAHELALFGATLLVGHFK